MATMVNTHEAKTHLSRLLAQVEAGEEVYIARAGKRIAKLVRADAPQPRQFGTAAGSLVLQPGWDDPMSDEEIAEFEDGPIFPTDDDL